MRILVGVIWLALSGAAFTMVAARKDKEVTASFIWDSEVWTDKLSNPNSDEYKKLNETVVDEVTDALEDELGNRFIRFTVQFFSNANGSVNVNSKVFTTYKRQKAANNNVFKALRNSVIPGLDPSSVSVGVRLCVPVKGTCDMLKNVIPTNFLKRFSCIEARDRYECLRWLNNEKVDLFLGDTADLHFAADRYKGSFHVIAESRNNEEDDYRYRAVAVVRHSTIHNFDDLKHSHSCHTGYGKYSGWHVPISKLLENGTMVPDCYNNSTMVENELRTVSKYFGDACIPGKWVPDPEHDKSLKEDYNNLCSLCDNPTECSQNDPHAGYDGALKCLIDEHADVAWTKLDAVDTFFASPSVNKSDFGLLCYDGTIVEIGSPDECSWADKPWSAWLTWRTGNTNALVNTLRALAKVLTRKWDQRAQLAKDVLGINNEQGIIKSRPSISPYEYLNRAGYYPTIPEAMDCPRTVRLCVVGAEAEEKCKELGCALKSQGVQPNIACVVEADEDTCVDAIANNNADFITLDGGDMFKAYSDHGLIPVISEAYGDSHVSYYAVAVVNEGSTISSLEDLQGKKSCHTGINKSAGWKVPVMTLVEEDLLDETNGDCAGQIGNFFNESCAPGAKNEKYDPDGTNPSSLCNLCVGNEDGDHKCDRDSDERYYGYTGAFRCLVEGGGDVAFIKHTTVPANTGLPFDDDEDRWNQNLDASDYRLLCLDGTQREVSAYESCHWASVPSHKVVTRKDANGVIQEEIRILLLQASEILPHSFLFGDYGGVRDIIFKSSATSLENLSENEFLDLLEDTYGKAITELGTCQA